MLRLWLDHISHYPACAMPVSTRGQRACPSQFKFIAFGEVSLKAVHWSVSLCLKAGDMNSVML